jgi:hypothetical protein
MNYYIDYTTQRLFFSTCFTASCIGAIMICWFWFGIRAALRDNEQLTQRLFTVAQNLQLAERMTGQPFYTSILDGALPCEKKDRLYLGMRNDFYGKCTGMLQREERMPVSSCEDEGSEEE